MKDIIKKWWFWVVILAIVIAISFTIIMLVAFNTATGGINEVAMRVQEIDNDATLYSSAGGNTVIVEIPNYTDNTKKDKVDKIKNTIKEYSNNNNILSNYSNFILIRKINSDDKKDYFYNTNVYNLPSMIEDIEKGKTYIDFLEFTKETLGNSSISSSNMSSNTTSNTTTTTKGEDIELTAGKYVVGEDIKVGKYDAIAQSGNGNIYVEGSTSVIESMGTTNDNYYLRNYNNITLKNGDTVEITGKLKVKLQAK